MVTKIYKQRRVIPYQANGRQTIQINKAIGVYVIYKNDTPVYVGYSGSDVKKTMYRHFQEWNDLSQYRVVYKNKKDITVRVVFCKDKKTAANLEKALILKYKPRDNDKKYREYAHLAGVKEAVKMYMDVQTGTLIETDGEYPF
ncbi:MAG: GIY-YIG nuclease family protein [Bacteroidetes bacterium]|nr:GIY-YIG nuclease family protein [Bacteroidota bacterium]